MNSADEYLVLEKAILRVRWRHLCSSPTVAVKHAQWLTCREYSWRQCDGEERGKFPTVKGFLSGQKSRSPARQHSLRSPRAVVHSCVLTLCGRAVIFCVSAARPFPRFADWAGRSIARWRFPTFLQLHIRSESRVKSDIRSIPTRKWRQN